MSWDKIVEDQAKAQEEILKNATITSNPRFHAAVHILAALAANSKSTEDKDSMLIVQAMSLADGLVEKFKNE